MSDDAVQQLERHVRMLAETMGSRCMSQPETLERAARYVEDALRATGLPVQQQAYQADGQTVRNVYATKHGSDPTKPMVVIGAHYDTCDNTPGADDNASGVAALIELAGRCVNTPLECTVRFAAFVNEEAPYFGTDAMGSLVYVQEAKRCGDRVALMLSLEMLGYYSDRPGSQQYPPLFGIGRPQRGDFIGIVGRTGSGRLLRRIETAFRGGTPLPLEVASAPEWVEGVSLSDQWAFWQAGYPAVMATDTAFYRNPHYHTERDTSDTLDYGRMARVVDGLEAVIRAFA